MKLTHREEEEEQMGCTQSKIKNEEEVARCKEWKNYMKEAVSACNAFVAAHSSYAIYLKNTSAALSDYAQGEVQNPQLPHHQAQPISSATAAAVSSVAAPFVNAVIKPEVGDGVGELAREGVDDERDVLELGGIEEGGEDEGVEKVAGGSRRWRWRMLPRSAEMEPRSVALGRGKAVILRRISKTEKRKKN